MEDSTEVLALQRASNEEGAPARVTTKGLSAPNVACITPWADGTHGVIDLTDADTPTLDLIAPPGVDD
jgi:hypothetical protein